ncbi:MAG TPA: three-Cys-motif partner protein TcmP, partial [Epsilonproteobacteria bacterium]|nr:three-Cys-motif partner protein TcmP [Campylobacterota bacterium]
MATLKQGEKNYLEEHSKEKVAFYEKYLNLYLTVLINAQYVNAINIYDIFCGVGIYDGDGSKGSPVVAMECIKKQLKIHRKNRDKPINLLINDGDKKRVNIAKNYI